MGAILRTSNKTDIANTTSISLTKPTGTVDGDLLVTIIACLGTAAPSSVPSGWTLIRSTDSGGVGTQASLHTYYKIASSEGSSYSWTSSTAPSGGMILRIDGQDSVTAIDTSGGSGNQGANLSTSQVFGSTVTPSIANNLILSVIHSYDADSGTPSITSHAVATSNPSWTELYDSAYNSGSANNQVMGLAYAIRPEITGTGNQTVVLAGTQPERTTGQVISINRFTAGIYTDTITETDTFSSTATFQNTYTDTITETDTATEVKDKKWTNDTKNTTTWINDTKH